MAKQRFGRLSVGTQALIGLVIGLAAGAAIAAAAQPMLLAIGAAVEVFGTPWINAILMCILPLVVSKLIVSIAGQDEPQVVGRAGWQAAALFIGLLTVTGAILAAIETVLKEGPRTRDMGGTASTEELGKAVAEAL
jgi:Na+/H+-dicarboxylate symporter